MSEISDLTGKTLAKIERPNFSRFRFTLDDGSVYEWRRKDIAAEQREVVTIGRDADLIESPNLEILAPKMSSCVSDLGRHHHVVYEFRTAEASVWMGWDCRPCDFAKYQSDPWHELVAVEVKS